MGYHIKKIKKGKLGQFSKIEEEYAELLDAKKQKNIVLQIIEMSDMIGAIEYYLKPFNITIEDLIKMNKLTESAFLDGSRKNGK